MNLNSVFHHANSTVGNGLAGRTGAPHETNLYLKSAMTDLLSTLALFSHTSLHLLLLQSCSGQNTEENAAFLSC